MLSGMPKYTEAIFFFYNNGVALNDLLQVGFLAATEEANEGRSAHI